MGACGKMVNLAKSGPGIPNLILKSFGDLKVGKTKVCNSVEAVLTVEQQKDPWTLRLKTRSYPSFGTSCDLGWTPTLTGPQGGLLRPFPALSMIP